MTSPNYPRSYPSDLTCVWVIEVASTHVIELEFKTFDIEDSKKCKYDTLEIFDGSTVSLLNARGVECFATLESLQLVGRNYHRRFSRSDGLLICPRVAGMGQQFTGSVPRGTDLMNSLVGR